jgi:hypothetical protein
MAASANVKHVPVRDLVVKEDGHIRPLTYYGGKGLDVRTVSSKRPAALRYADRTEGGRPPFDLVLMFDSCHPGD